MTESPRSDAPRYRPLRDLERDFRDGRLSPAEVPLDMPTSATQDMRKVAGDLVLRVGLQRAVGDDRPTPYSARMAAAALDAPDDPKRGSRAIRALVKAGVIVEAGQLPPRGQPRGTKLYAIPVGAVPCEPGDGEAGAGAAVVEAVEPTGELPQHTLVPDAEVGVGRLDGLAAPERGAQRQLGLAHDLAQASSPDGGYVGGPCPDPLRCRYWKRHASGPWTCEYNHPRTEAVA